jgi:phosphohistidine swiveling domain-containing protein
MSHTIQAFDEQSPDQSPLPEEWNDSLAGDYAWTNQLVAEGFPEVMTPSTWSVWEILFERQKIGDVLGVGNIGGRPYANVSMLYSLMKKLLRSHDKAVAYIENVLCPIPEGIEIPAVSIPTKVLLFEVLPYQLKTESAKRRLEKRLAEVIATVLERCRALQLQIQQTQSGAGLTSAWREHVEPLFSDLLTLQDASNEKVFFLYGSLKKQLTQLCGESEANILLSSMGDDSEQLASLGLLAGLEAVARGEMSRAEYEMQYGHRGPRENYISAPRPAEEPGWLDRQLEDLEKSPVDAAALLERRRLEYERVWREFEGRYPKKSKSIRQKLDDVARRSRTRESVRLELTRVVGVIRALFLRAGELTGLNEEVFFLTVPELMDVLAGDDSATAHIPGRQVAYARYSALPPYPAFINGHFDPFQWASNPARRSDIFDAHAPVPMAKSGAIKGYAGSSGRVEGVVRRIDSPEEGDQIQPGEILVTVTTNVGWTPLFPRAAAVVTDIGAQLSHAAIVARELGIPAVVGCGDATMRLKTGDRVVVDGGQGVVEILE